MLTNHGDYAVPSELQSQVLGKVATIRQPESVGMRGSLHAKTLVLVSGTILGLLVMLYVPLQIFLLSSFSELETQMVQTDMVRALDGLAIRAARLDTLSTSYAVRDDTYRFVQDRNPSFIIRNTYDGVFDTARINLMLAVNTRGELVFGKAYDLVEQRPVQLPEAFRSPGTDVRLLERLNVTSPVTGVLLLDEAPMLIAAHPIMMSQGLGPQQGAFVVGRYLDAAEAQRLSRALHLEVSFHRPDDSHVVSDIVRALPGLKTAPTVVQPLNEQAIAGYARLPDLGGQGELIMRVELPRTIMHSGQNAMRYVMISLLLIGSVFGLLVLIIIERAVLVRLGRLSNGVQWIGARNDLAARVPVQGRDELARLAQAINTMLDDLQRARTEREQRAHEHELLRRREEQIQAKRNAISVVAHELCTPLTPIRAYVDVLLRDKQRLADDQRECLEMVRASTQTLIDLVGDLLELVRAEEHRIELEIAPLQLGELVAEVAWLLQPELERTQVSLSQALPGDLPPVAADRKRVRQILTNLLSNAVKYTHPGGQVWVRATARTDGWMEIEIEDTGIGMTLEDQQQLFTPFYRVKSPLHDQVRGTGLGLAITRSLVELHGGTIQVQSQAGVGSVFSVTLPLWQTQPV